MLTTAICHNRKGFFRASLLVISTKKSQLAGKRLGFCVQSGLCKNLQRFKWAPKRIHSFFSLFCNSIQELVVWKGNFIPSIVKPLFGSCEYSQPFLAAAVCVSLCFVPTPLRFLMVCCRLAQVFKHVTGLFYCVQVAWPLLVAQTTLDKLVW